LDVDIGGLGIELGSIPNQPRHWNVDGIEGWNSTQGLDFADKLAEFIDKPAEWTVNSAKHVWMNLNRFDEI
jgi:hypothetical protein